MKPRLTFMLALGLVLAACGAPAAAPTAAPEVTRIVSGTPETAIVPATPTRVAPAATQRPEATAPQVGVAPPASGGAAAAPTQAATSTAARPGWAQINAANPPPARFDHTVTLDTANNKLVVFGGRDGAKTLGDTWVYDLRSNAWREVKPSPAPGARFGHAAAFDAKSKRVLIFAGQAGGFFNDVWTFDAARETWQKLETKGTAPVARYGTSAVVDAKRNQLIISHGFASGRFDDTFALDLATNTWSQIRPVDGQPLNRCLHESVYDTRSDRMILFGGCSSGYGPCPQGDLWSLNVAGKDWNEVSPAGVKPSPRSNPALVGDDASRLILFGGNTGDGPIADVWALNLSTGEWTNLTPAAAAPAARYSHDAAWNPAAKQVIVFGGRGSTGALNDMWVLTP